MKMAVDPEGVSTEELAVMLIQCLCVLVPIVLFFGVIIIIVLNWAGVI